MPEKAAFGRGTWLAMTEDMTFRAVSWVALVLGSLSSVACAGTSAGDGGEAGGEEPAARSGEGAEVSAPTGPGALSTEEGVMPMTSTPSDAPSMMLPASSVVPSSAVLGKLVATSARSGVPERTFEVLGFEFGVSNTATFGSGTLVGNKASFDTLKLKTRALGGSRPLGDLSVVGTGAHYASLVLHTGGATPVTFTFEVALVTRVSNVASAEGDIESTELEFGKVQIEHEKLLASHSVLRATTKVPETCLDGDRPRSLGPYTQTTPNGWVARGTTAIDALAVSVVNASPLPGTGGVTASKASLEDFTIAGPFHGSALCALGQIGLGKGSPDLVVDVAAPELGRATKRWQACRVLPTRLVIASTKTGLVQKISVAAGAVVRTDFAFDPMGQPDPANDHVAGWSFFTNTGDTSVCPKL